MSPALSVQDVYKAPMTGHQHNGLPEPKGYRHKGRGFDIYDPTDPGHPDYINPRAKAAPRNPKPGPVPVALSLAERNAARRAADTARAAAKRVRRAS